MAMVLALTVLTMIGFCLNQVRGIRLRDPNLRPQQRRQEDTA
jgi:hypothetical protein